MDLSWLVGQRITAVTLGEGLSWTWVFQGSAVLRVACLWRILEDGRIILTSEDHNQLFGHSVPVNAQEKAMDLVAGEPITHAVLREGTLDIFVELANGRRLEILPTSVGYESWELIDSSKRVTVAQGGGNLVTF
jgi:hypothetical protein